MNEQISALIDDEIALEDAAHLMAALQANSGAAQAWSHYHLIGDAMRGTEALSPNFKHNLMQKIELEPTVLSPNAGQFNQNDVEKSDKQTAIHIASAKHKLPAAWSIAASFAAVMVVSYMVLQTQFSNNGALTQVAQAPTLQVADTIQLALAPQDAPMLVTANEQAIPEEYLMAHQASAPTASSYYIQTASYSK